MADGNRLVADSLAFGQDRDVVSRSWPARHRRAAGIVLVALASIGAGCSGSSDDGKQEATREQWSNDRVRAATARAWLELPGGDDSAGLTRFLIEEVEQLVAACMTDQGFEYEAAPYESIIGEGTDGGDFTDRDYVAQHGFGATEPLSPPAAENPNDRITASLSEEEMSAYDDALQRCNDDAHADQEDRYNLQEIIEVSQELNRLVEASAPVVAARNEYQRCLSARGFTASSPEELRASYFDRAGPVAAGESGQGDSQDALRAEEIEAALASFDCGRDLATVRAEERRRHMEDLNPAIYELVYD